MNDNDRNKKLVYVCILGIIAVVVFLLFLLYLIWFPTNRRNVENNIDGQNETIVESSADDNLGKYKTISKNERNQLTEYSQRILTLFLSRDIDSIYNIINKEYIEYYNLDKTKIQNMLDEKYLLGRQLSIYQYSAAEVNGRTAFLVYVRSNDKMVEDTFVISETSPRNYSISFDNFIFHDITKKEYIRDGVKYTLFDQVGYVNSYSAKVNIFNISDGDIIVNKDHNYEICYLKMSDKNMIRTTETFLSGEAFTVKKNGELNAKMTFPIDRLAYPKMDSIVLKAITINSGTETKDVEIPLK